jgi:hypothetical protein
MTILTNQQAAIIAPADPPRFTPFLLHNDSAIIARIQIIPFTTRWLGDVEE